jgi:hypothetical protein
VVAAAGEAKEEEEEEGKKGVLKKRARGRLVWRRILFALKKTLSIITLNALTIIYGMRISFGLFLRSHSSTRYLISASTIFSSMQQSVRRRRRADL